MGRYCAANDCSNSNKDKDKGISLHTFPKESTLRNKWAFAMNRKGFQPNNYSSVCSVHFKPEDFEVDEKNASHRKRPHLKKNVIPTIFTAGLPSHLQAGEKKQRVFQRVNPTSNVKLKLPPVCVADENPCCEREAWENIPIVSSMCRKCADFCAGIAPQQVKRLSDKKVAGEIENIFRGGTPRGPFKYSTLAKGQEARSVQRSEGLKAVKCNECGVMLDDKYTLPSHIKRVHMKMSQLHDVILGRKRLLVSRLPW